MAKSKKAAPKAAKPIETEPLSNFQTPKTGRVTEDLFPLNGLKISYIKVQPETNFLEIVADDTNHQLPKDISDTLKAPVHKNLINAIQKLRPHAAALIDHLGHEEDFNVTSVHFKTHKKRGDSIQINATLTTVRDKAFNFTTPIEYIFEETENSYENNRALIKIRGEIFSRINKYLSGEERGDPNDVGMFKKEAEEKSRNKKKSDAELFTDETGEETDVTSRYADKDN